MELRVFVVVEEVDGGGGQLESAVQECGYLASGDVAVGAVSVGGAASGDALLGQPDDVVGEWVAGDVAENGERRGVGEGLAVGAGHGHRDGVGASRRRCEDELLGVGGGEPVGSGCCPSQGVRPAAVEASRGESGGRRSRGEDGAFDLDRLRRRRRSATAASSGCGGCGGRGGVAEDPGAGLFDGEDVLGCDLEFDFDGERLAGCGVVQRFEAVVDGGEMLCELHELGVAHE